METWGGDGDPDQAMRMEEEGGRGDLKKPLQHGKSALRRYSKKQNQNKHLRV